MSSWKITRITYGKCVNMIDGLKKKDWCAHFLAGGEEGTPEAFFCRGCGCHLCFHEKEVETSYDRSTSTVSYTQCLKNHAPQTDGSWVDGCGEFVAAGEEGTPEALSCAACGCHRSFHKKEYWIGREAKDHCRHFLACGKEGTPESFFCHGCGCHLCFHWKYVEKEIDMSTAILKYGKCLKNHTAHLGGRSTLDGCGEFMAVGEEGTQEAFSCAACSCHRSFHEKDYL